MTDAEIAKPFDIASRCVCATAIVVMTIFGCYWASTINQTLQSDIGRAFARVNSAQEAQDYRSRCLELEQSIKAFQTDNRRLDRMIRFLDERFPEAKKMRRDLEEFER